MKIVYALRNKENGKMYIGSTEAAITGRVGNHIKDLRNGYHKNLDMLNDFYPDAEIQVYLLDLVPDNTAMVREREYYWMLAYRTFDPEYGYNNRDHMCGKPDIANHYLLYDGTLKNYNSQSITARRLSHRLLNEPDYGEYPNEDYNTNEI